MTSISHALIGAAIAAKIDNPVLVAGMSFTSHFLCDAIPHWDLGTNWRLRPKAVTGILAILETLISIFGTFWIFSHFVPNQVTLVIAIFFSVLPDWIEAPYYLISPPPKIFVWMYKLQHYIHEKLEAPAGIWTQVISVAVFLVVGFLI